MGSIVRHIDDIIEEYGSWENYEKKQEMENAKYNVELSVYKKLIIRLSDQGALIFAHTCEGLKVIEAAGSSYDPTKPESMNCFLILFIDPV